MKLEKPKRINGRVHVLSAQDAVNYIPDEATLCVLEAGSGILEATSLITTLADNYKTTQSPRDLSLISPTGLSDRAERGISPLAEEGLVKWALCGHWGQSPRISDLAEQNKIVAYNYPQRVLTQAIRASAAHQTGILSNIGISTFVDPRQQGGKLTIVQEGKVKKFIQEIPEITFNGKIALERGLDVRYITERAVFTLKADGLHLVEIAPGVDLEKDILAQMDFTPVISPDLKLMDTRLFFDDVMGFVLLDVWGNNRFYIAKGESFR